MFAPKLMLRTSLPLSTTHWMLLIIQSLYPNSALERTLTFRSEAPGATPVYIPPLPAPVPAAMLATWVPWLNPSMDGSSGTKDTEEETLPARSGCV